MPAELAAPPRRRWWRRALVWTGGSVVAYGVAVVLGLEPALPFDVVQNLVGTPSFADLRAPADGKVRLVVLQHGLWRTPWSMWRLERALSAHGYEVIAPGYPSTRCSIEEAAAMLRQAIDRAVGDRQGVEIAFVAHSMGGLVVQEYLRGDGARTPFAAVYIGVPHRGAVLCDLRRDWWPFPLLLGRRAALQLSPGDAFHRRPILQLGASAAVVGDLGDGNAAIPGADDGTVAVTEATLTGAAAVVHLPLGHTAIAADTATVREVLHFLRHGRFSRP